MIMKLITDEYGRQWNFIDDYDSNAGYLCIRCDKPLPGGKAFYNQLGLGYCCYDCASDRMKANAFADTLIEEPPPQNSLPWMATSGVVYAGSWNSITDATKRIST